MSIVFVAGIAMPVEGYHHLWESIGADEAIDMYHGRHPRSPEEFADYIRSATGKSDVVVGHSLGAFIALAVYGHAKKAIMLDPPMTKGISTALRIIPAVPGWSIYSIRKIGIERHARVASSYMKNLLLHAPKYISWVPWMRKMTIRAIGADIPTVSSVNDDFGGWFWKTDAGKSMRNAKIFNYQNHASLVVDYLPDGSPGDEIREAVRAIRNFIRH